MTERTVFWRDLPNVCISAECPHPAYNYEHLLGAWCCARSRGPGGEQNKNFIFVNLALQRGEMSSGKCIMLEVMVFEAVEE